MTWFEFNAVIEARLAAYEQRAEQGLPTCGPGEPAQPHELSRGGGCVVECWACGARVDGRVLDKRGWQMRTSEQFGESIREIYCANCFREYGWGGEFKVYHYGA